MSKRTLAALSRGGIRVSHIDRTGSMWRAGLREGDWVLDVNGEVVEHDLDFTFYSATDHGEIRFLRRGHLRTVRFERVPAVPAGVSFVQKPVRRCRNRCIFCFIDQLPPGLRKCLYVKDEDYRHSFLNGNYITLCGASNDELRRIVRLGLSPLFISVHSLDSGVRRAMLRNRHAGQLHRQLTYLSRNGIRFHAQIVLCPGINDGEMLRATVQGLCRFRRSLLSLAVVPVGLTRYHANGLSMVDADLAARTVHDVEKWSDADRLRTGVRRVFAADELYIRAARSIPPYAYYGDYPQIENGVGLVRMLLHEWQAVRRHIRSGPRASVRRPVLVLTSVDAEPYLQRIAAWVNSRLTKTEMHVYAVKNDFLGRTITVAGLLTARDMLRAVRLSTRRPSLIVVPRVVLNYRGFTLDGYSLDRMERELGIRVRVADGIRDLVAILNGKW